MSGSIAILTVFVAVPVLAQHGAGALVLSATTPVSQPLAPEKPAAVQGVQPPPGYVIGPEDQLAIVFWRDADMTTEVAVRPDGKITLPLINEVEARGLTPEQLRGGDNDAS